MDSNSNPMGDIGGLLDMGTMMDIDNESSDEDQEDETEERTDFNANLYGQKEYHYTGLNGKLLPLYEEPHRSSDRLGSLFPGEDILSYGSTANLNHQGEELLEGRGISDFWLKLRLSDYENDVEYSSELEADLFHELYVWVPRFFNGIEVVLPGLGDGEQRPLVVPPGDSLTINAVYEVTGCNGAVVREGLETTTQEITVLNTGEQVHVDEEAFNLDGTLRLHIILPVTGWISKLVGLLRKISKDKVSDDEIVKEPGRLEVCDTKVESEWDLLERVDDDMEHWGGSESYRKEDRFFGTLQGGAYQVRVIRKTRIRGYS
jgi:hypothetical protein